MKTLTITCSSCGTTWTDGHRCDVAPQIDYSRYTTAALDALARQLDLVLKDRRALGVE